MQLCSIQSINRHSPDCIKSTFLRKIKKRWIIYLFSTFSPVYSNIRTIDFCGHVDALQFNTRWKKNVCVPSGGNARFSNLKWQKKKLNGNELENYVSEISNLYNVKATRIFFPRLINKIHYLLLWELFVWRL